MLPIMNFTPVFKYQCIALRYNYVRGIDARAYPIRVILLCHLNPQFRQTR